MEKRTVRICEMIIQPGMYDVPDVTCRNPAVYVHSLCGTLCCAACLASMQSDPSLTKDYVPLVAALDFVGEAAALLGELVWLDDKIVRLESDPESGSEHIDAYLCAFRDAMGKAHALFGSPQPSAPESPDETSNNGSEGS